MYKYFTLLLSIFLLAEDKIVEVYSKSLEANETMAIAKDEVLVKYDNKILYANRGIYNFLNKKLFLKGNVKIVNPLTKRVINASSLEVDFNENEKIKFKNFFEIDKKEIWIKAKEAIKKNNFIYLENAIFSSCNLKNPDWKITFQKAKYIIKNKELKLKNALFYIKKIPIFYFPYIPLYFSKTRRSGLLSPSFNYSKNEGFLYLQPIFWAISPSYDLEVSPQIRTKRGHGVYMTYRFVDTKYSFGELKFGYFKDKNSFFQEYNLKYNKHYGVEFFYKNSNLISYLKSKNIQNKLYINIVNFNDEEYLNLQLKDKLSHHKIGNFYESRLNLFFKGESFYTGLYLKYFKDSTKTNNKDTLKLLPKIEFSTPYKTILYNNFYYKLYFALSNYTREEGTKALKIKFKAPFEFHKSILNDYLNLNITQEIEATGYDFYNVPLNQKKYSSIVLNNKINLSTELIKTYKNGTTHLIELSSTYTKSEIISQNFMKYKEIPKDLKQDFVDDIPFESKIDFRLHQYLNSKNLKVEHILDLDYYLNNKKFENLHQELKLSYKNFFLESNFKYSFLYSKTTNINNKIGFLKSNYGAWISFLWKKDILSLETISKEITIGGNYQYNSNLKFDTSITYNIKDKTLKEWRLHTFYKRKCWSLDFSIGQDIKPIIKSNGQRGSISNKFIQFQIKVLPFAN